MTLPQGSENSLEISFPPWRWSCTLFTLHFHSAALPVPEPRIGTCRGRLTNFFTTDDVGNNHPAHCDAENGSFRRISFTESDLTSIAVRGLSQSPLFFPLCHRGTKTARHRCAESCKRAGLCYARCVACRFLCYGRSTGPNFIALTGTIHTIIFSN